VWPDWLKLIQLPALLLFGLAVIGAASDVSSLSQSLHRWEIAEYIFEGLVIIACAGELVADLGRKCLKRAHRDRIQRLSTILLVAALSMELICLVKTNDLSGRVIGSLGDRADEADRKAKTAITDSATALSQANDALSKAGKAQESLGKAEEEANKAQTASSNALTLARGARQEADSFEKDIRSAKDAAAKAEAKLADRTLTDEQVRSIAAKLSVFSGQAYTVTAYWDSKESLGITNRIHSALLLARWAYSEEGSKSWMLGGEIGVLVWTHPDAGESTKKAATSLIDALNAEGIEATPRLQNPKNPKSDMISVNVGAKR
jgi:hypothetical protein